MMNKNRFGRSVCAGALCCIAVALGWLGCGDLAEDDYYRQLDDTNEPMSCQGNDVVVIGDDVRDEPDPGLEKKIFHATIVNGCEEGYRQGFESTEGDLGALINLLYGRRECLQGANDMAVSQIERQIAAHDEGGSRDIGTRFTLYRNLTRSACDLLVKASEQPEAEPAALQRLDCGARFEKTIAELIAAMVDFGVDAEVQLRLVNDKARTRHERCFDDFDDAPARNSDEELDRHVALFACLDEWLLGQRERMITAYVGNVPGTDNAELRSQVGLLLSDLLDQQRNLCTSLALASEDAGTEQEAVAIGRCQVKALVDANTMVDNFVKD